MKLKHWLVSVSLTCSSILLVSAIGQDTPAPPKANPPVQTKPGELPDGIQIENRGPVHEAFANPGAPTRGGKEGSTAPKAPPPQVPELPPDEKPTGENVVWIPGYWQYDLEKSDFIWVSGFWRNAPPGRSWTQGEWKLENGQHRYIPGYWKQSNESSWRIDLPEPPRSVEAGPNIPAPHNDAQWIPGHWVFRNENYVWQPGYWGEVEDNMVWMPGQYCYTGSGYRYVSGYWDYCLEDRGLLYAPVFFTRPLWLTPGWAFRPCFGINIGFGGGWGWGWGGFYDNLYFGPGYGSFWFGNYGGLWGWGAGFRPWCWNGYRGFANPVFNHYCWLNRQNPGWRNHHQQGYAARQFGVIPGAGRHVNGSVGGGRQFHVNQNALNNATNLVGRVSGERAAQQLADRVGKGTTLQQVNTALKQTSSSTLVQPAKDVMRNQKLAQSLPSRNTLVDQKPVMSNTARSTDIGNSIRNATLNANSSVANRNLSASNSRVLTNRPSLAPYSESQLRNQIGSAVRNVPSGAINRSVDVSQGTRRTMEGSSNSLRSMSGASNSTLRLSSGNSFSGRSLGSSSSNLSSSRSISPGFSSGSNSSSFRSLPSTGSFSGSSSRGTISSGNTGGVSRGSIGGSNFGGFRGSSGGSFGGVGGSRGGGSMGGGGARGGGGKR